MYLYRLYSSIWFLCLYYSEILFFKILNRINTQVKCSTIQKRASGHLYLVHGNDNTGINKVDKSSQSVGCINPSSQGLLSPPHIVISSLLGNRSNHCSHAILPRVSSFWNCSFVFSILHLAVV